MSGDTTRLTIRLLAAVIVLAAVGGLIFVWAAPREVAAEGLSRATPARAAMVGREIAVTTRIASTMSACPSPTQRPSFDVALVLDRSGSMAGGAFEQAQRAALAFVDEADLSRLQMAVVFFNDAAQEAQGLTSDAAALRQAIATGSAEGGTAIDAALLAARTALHGAARRSAARGMVILFTDGGSDPDQAIAAANALKDEGTRIVVVGLQGDDFSPDLLAQIASTPSDLTISPTPSELTGFFTSIAVSLNTSVATDLQVEEIPGGGFEPVQAPASPPGSVVNNRLAWQFPSVSEDGVTMQYVLFAQRVGWWPVATANGSLSFTACDGTPITRSMVEGPHVLIYPPPGAACLLPLLALVPIILALLGWPRRKAAPLTPAPPIPQITTFERGLPPMDWVRSIRRLEGVDAAEAPDYPPTLILGVGEAGRWVLTHIKKNLHDRFGAVPRQVRFLLVDIDRPDRPAQIRVGGVSLSPQSEEVLFKPDRQRIIQAKRESPAALDWWRDLGGHEPTRLDGRVALYWGTQAGDDSLLLRQLSQAVRELASPQAFIVASLADPFGGSVVWDLACFLRNATDTSASATRVSPWLLLPPLPTALGSSGLSERARRFAAMREMDRHMRNLPAYFHYIDRHISRLAPRGSADIIYLFESQDEDTEKGVDLSREPLEHGLAVIVADCLTAAIEPNAGYGEHVQNVLREIGEARSPSGAALVNSAGCAVYKLPVADIRRAAEARFLRAVLFNPDGDPGLAAWVQFEGEKDGPPQFRLAADTQLGDAEAQKEAERFLTSPDLQAGHPALEAVLRATRADAWEAAALPPTRGNLDEAFRWRLAEYLTRLLNGDDERYAVSRAGKLTRAWKIIAALRRLLETADSLARRDLPEPGSDDPGATVRGWVADWLAASRQAETAIEAWLKAIAPISLPGEQRQVRRSLLLPEAASPEAERPTLARIIQSEWNRARRELIDLQKPRHRHTFLSAPDPHKPNSGLEEPYYTRYLRPELDREHSIRPLEVPANRLMQRIAWYCDELDGRLRLRLLVLPPDFDGPEDGGRWQAWLLGPEELEKISRRLGDLARAFSREIYWSESLRNWIPQKESWSEAAAFLKRGAQAMLRYSPIESQQIGGVTPSARAFILASDVRMADQLREEATELALASRIVTGDPHMLAVMTMKNKIALPVLDHYRAAAEGYTPDPDLHVFPAEQAAARLEQERSRRGDAETLFHPLMVRLLENYERAELFGLAAIYGWVSLEDNQTVYWLRPPGSLPSIELVSKPSGVTLPMAMEAFVLTLPLGPENQRRTEHPFHGRNLRATLDRLWEAVKHERERPGDERRPRYDVFESEVLARLAAGGLLEREMAVFLRLLLSDERGR